MKKVLRSFLKFLGFDVRRIKSKVVNHPGKMTSFSIRTNNLSYYKTVTGNYYLPTDAKNDIIAITIINNNIFEKEVVDIAFKCIKENTLVLDIGANYGQMSILFADKVGENGKVYSFEADDFVFEILKKNISANDKQNLIVPFYGAVHNIDNEILYYPLQDFVEFGAYGSYGIDYNASNGRTVKSITIDSLEIELPISFMKIDIQGGDLKALQGAVNTIKRNKMPILFEYEYQFEDRYNMCFQDYVDFIASINYKFLKVLNGHNYLIIPA
jgi:FkbM family methyltransferase